MKKFLFLFLSFSLLANGTSKAQSIIVGPNSTLVWDDATDNVTAGGFVVNAIIDSAAPRVLTGVTCVANTTVTPNTATCSCLLSQIGLGSHTVALTNTSGTLVSVPSTPLTFVAILIPVPSNLRLKAENSVFSKIAHLVRLS